MVHLNRIYTRSGDGGETSLADGSRVRKTHPGIIAGGTIDEVNCLLGVAAAHDSPGHVQSLVLELQQELFDLGADLTVPLDVEAGTLHRTSEGDVRRLEDRIDGLNESLKPLQSFILPGGSKTSAFLHHARAICRRAEIDVLAAAQVSKLNPHVAVYLNRLSDLLFVMARATALRDGAEVLWIPRAGRD